MKRLFISKPSAEIQELSRWLMEEGFSVHAHSFLHFSPILSPLPSPFDVIFFSSPRSVIFFLSQYALPASVSIACAGEKTAEIVRSTARTVDFVGQQSGDMGAVAEAFKRWCAGRSVLFPVSTRSLKTVISVFPEEQCQELIVYETTIQGKAVETCDLYVFTSPSNSEGFLMENQVAVGAKVIAWGTSTARYLGEQGIDPTHTLTESSSEKLKEYLSSLF
ncbi:MAG: hypothetical protein A3D92_11340 [Bacteroidetes bacterium RIFCSPHIGHO2_02_FULL_44_7]|nr:MAG: hypothetical protein A3D92_11340 [Bacteroidetes bacterium RIFCSPHIGHO2_02_FULL_44_7]